MVRLLEANQGYGRSDPQHPSTTEQRSSLDNMAAPECSREVRKRRERRDSGSSHERKERRPHSEERPPSALPPPPLHDHNRLESERRAERLSRARRPQHGGKRRRQPFRITKQYNHEQSKENDCLLDKEEDLRTYDTTEVDCGTEKVQMYEPVRGVCVEWCVEEPVVSLSAVRPRPPPTPDAPRSPPPTDTHLEKRMYKINKKITVLQKNIAKYESEYETKHGAPITPSECMTDVQLTSMYETLRRLQAEKRCIKSDPIEYARAVQAAKLQKQRDEKLEASLRSDKTMAEVVDDIEEWLSGCRAAAGRSGPLESWSAGELSREKWCVQRALLRLEAARGRPPAHSKDRGAARGLYDTYRTVKRALRALRPDTMIGGNNGELATIHEHEAMLFNSSVDSSSDSQEKQSTCQNSDESPIQPNQPVTPGQSAQPDQPVTPVQSAQPVQSDQESPAEDLHSNEGLHCLSIDQLTRALIDAKIQKCVLKRTLKDYEVSFEQQNSRKIQKDDIIGKEDEYAKYKAVKARIKLLNALINKQKSTKTNITN